MNSSELEVIFHNAINQVITHTTASLAQRELSSVTVVVVPILINVNNSTTEIIAEPTRLECIQEQYKGELWKLTRREAQSIELLAAGLTNREIAEKLSIGLQPVSNYLSTAYRKMKVNNALGAVLLWQQTYKGSIEKD